jgi:hypothetical protein
MILLPAYHPGAQDSSQTVHLKAVLPKITEAVAGSMPDLDVQSLLAPLQELAEEPALRSGGPGAMIFRSPSEFRQFHLPGTVPEWWGVGQHFQVAALLPYLSAEREFYILNIARKDLRLWHHQDGQCQEVELPNSLPKSAEEAGGFDQPDHSLQNRSAAGSSAGNMRGVHFSTGSERDLAPERLLYFFKLVDAALRGLLHGVLLVLTGTENELGIYRRASNYPKLLGETLAGDLRNAALQDIEKLAARFARAHALREAEGALQEFYELLGRGRGSQNPEQILNSAAEGRVLKLIVAERAQPPSDGGVPSGETGAENLVNAAAVFTIRNGGQVLSMPGELMASASPMAAVFRY